MKHYLFDTSVIVAGIIKSHPHYQHAHPWISKVQNKKLNASISTHCLAELYAVLSTLPIQPSLSPQFVSNQIFNEIIPLFEVIDLSTKDYRLGIKRCSRLHSRSGRIYDTLHIQACLKKKLDGIVTLNQRDFESLSSGDIKVINPLENKP